LCRGAGVPGVPGVPGEREARGALIFLALDLLDGCRQIRNLAGCSDDGETALSQRTWR
jgi:hypothetical protein